MAEYPAGVAMRPGQALGITMRTGANRYYGSPFGLLNNGAITAGTLFYVPLWVPRPITISELYMNVSSAGGAGSVLRAGVYASDALTGDPLTLLAEAATTLSGVTTGGKQFSITLGLFEGLYWLAAAAQVANTTVYVQDYLGGQMPVATGANLVGRGFSQSGVTAALPATATPVVNDSSLPPRILAKVA